MNRLPAHPPPPVIADQRNLERRLPVRLGTALERVLEEFFPAKTAVNTGCAAVTCAVSLCAGLYSLSAGTVIGQVRRSE